MTDDVIRWHLSGADAHGAPFVAGVYPLLLDERCFFLAIDFDKAAWREDVTAFVDSCKRLEMPVSRSATNASSLQLASTLVRDSMIRGLIRSF